MHAVSTVHMQKSLWGVKKMKFPEPIGNGPGWSGNTPEGSPEVGNVVLERFLIALCGHWWACMHAVCTVHMQKSLWGVKKMKFPEPIGNGPGWSDSDRRHRQDLYYVQVC